MRTPRTSAFTLAERTVARSLSRRKRYIPVLYSTTANASDEPSAAADPLLASPECDITSRSANNFARRRHHPLSSCFLIHNPCLSSSAAPAPQLRNISTTAIRLKEADTKNPEDAVASENKEGDLLDSVISSKGEGVVAALGNKGGDLLDSVLPPKTGAKNEIKFPAQARPTVHHTAPTFRATKVHFTGEVETLNVKSTDLLKTSKIHARDLFDLNLTSRQERARRVANARRGPFRVQRSMAAIVGRPTSIVLSFAQVRAIVGRHFVMFLEAHDPAVQDFARELADRYQQISSKNDEIWNGNEAMELIFLEEVLRNSVDSFNRRLRLYEPIVNSFLDSVANEVYSDTGVHQLVPLKDSLQSFEMHVKQCLDCLTELLDDDEEMLALLLTEQAKARETGKPVDFQRHQHVELLLGVYARQLNNTLMEIQFLLQRIQSKQEFVTLALAGYRNRLVRTNVTISIATLSLCLATSIAGFYGMNVVNGLEQSTTAFSTIVFSSTVTGLALGAGSLNYLSGRTMQNRAAIRLGEIEALSGALSDMCALDYAVKSTLEHGTTITREEFRTKLRRARQSGEVTDREVDLLFRVLDTVKDGLLGKEDLTSMGWQSILHKDGWSLNTENKWRASSVPKEEQSD